MNVNKGASYTNVGILIYKCIHEREQQVNVNRGRVILYIISLPSSTTVPIEARTIPRRRSDREPRRQRMELRRGAKLIFVLTHVMMSEYKSSFSLKFPAIRLITFEPLTWKGLLLQCRRRLD